MITIVLFLLLLLTADQALMCQNLYNHNSVRFVGPHAEETKTDPTEVWLPGLHGFGFRTGAVSQFGLYYR